MRFKFPFVAALTALVLAASGCAAVGNLNSNDVGADGGPVHLTVGYQPYYTEAWSGVVMRGKEFWKKYLPAGSTVDFQLGLQGSVVVSQMLAGKQQIGYVGDMPAIVAVSKRHTRDLRIVATLGLAQDQCAVFLTRPDAPDFSSQQAAVNWFGGKTIATPQGSCTDRIAQATFEKFHTKPGAYLNQSVDVITSNFQGHKIDGAIMWEPTASKLIDSGLARRVASGTLADAHDGGFLLMDKHFSDTHPKVAKAWLKAELDAQRFLANPANAAQIVQMAKEQTVGYTDQELRDALYRQWPTNLGGTADGIRLRLPFVPTGDSVTLVDAATAFLYRIKAIPSATLPAGAVEPDLAATVLRESGLSPTQGVGLIQAQHY